MEGNSPGSPLDTQSVKAQILAETMNRGVKYDSEKVALDLIDPLFELAVAEVLTYGARKYEKNNWKKGMSLDKLIAGVKRHINALQRGEFYDPETGFQHTAHATCGLMFLHYHIQRGYIDYKDDRWEKNEN